MKYPIDGMADGPLLCFVCESAFSRRCCWGSYVSEPAEVREFVEPSLPRDLVTCRGVDYLIHSPEMADDEGQSWGRAAYALFKIVNDQLTDTEYRLFAINGGNELGGMFLTQSECENARSSPARPEDWPYLPTADHPWYGQAHR